MGSISFKIFQRLKSCAYLQIGKGSMSESVNDCFQQLLVFLARAISVKLMVIHYYLQ
jgi:hypothetical protein